MSTKANTFWDVRRRLTGLRDMPRTWPHCGTLWGLAYIYFRATLSEDSTKPSGTPFCEADGDGAGPLYRQRQLLGRETFLARWNSGPSSNPGNTTGLESI